MRGVGLVELLVAMSLVLILASFGYRWALVLLMEERLKVAKNTLMGDVNKVKLFSVTKDKMWGIRVERDRNCYVIFEDVDRNCRLGSSSLGSDACVYSGTQTFPNCDGSLDCVRVIKLPEGVLTSSDVSAVFDRKGYPRNAICGLGPFSVNLKNSLGTIRRVIVDRYGRVREEGPTRQ